MDINKKVQNLVSNTNKYYVSLDGENPKFEENYWGHSVLDPDGVQRDHLAEFNEDSRRFDYISNYIQRHECKHKEKILDVGCGLGAGLSSLKRNLHNNVELFGTEISKYAINNAKEFGTVLHTDLIQEQDVFCNGYFDIIICHHVIEHIPHPHPGLFINKLKDLLKTGGLLVLATPDFDSGAARLFKNNYRMLCDKTHVTLFSSDSMHRFLRDNGFNIIDVEYPYFDTEYFNKQSLMRLFDVQKKSPPFYGNFITFYCIKP